MKTDLPNLNVPPHASALTEGSASEGIHALAIVRGLRERIAMLEASEKCLEREVQSALETIPTRFVGNDAWQNGIIRMATEIEILRAALTQAKTDIVRIRQSPLSLEVTIAEGATGRIDRALSWPNILGQTRAAGPL